jgi:hypothetical protein
VTVYKCYPNPEAEGVVKMLEIRYIHRTSSSMMHNNEPQYGTCVQQVSQLKSRQMLICVLASVASKQTGLVLAFELCIT